MYNKSKSKEVTARIENWYVVLEGFVCYLKGYMHEDSRSKFPDGKQVETSGLLGGYQSIVEGEIVFTQNSSYLLGKPFTKDNNDSK